MKYSRLILGVIAIIILLLLMVYSAQEYDSNNPQVKKYQQIFMKADYVNNTEISFRAQVLTINQSNHTLRATIQEEPYNYPKIELSTEHLTIQDLKKGDLIDVIGNIQGKNKIAATQIWLDEAWKGDLVYLRSLPAIPFVLYLFFRTWKFDFSTWRFKRRTKDA